MYRSFYAMPPTLTRPSDGKPIGAVAGVANSLFRFALPYALSGATIVFAVDARDKAASWRVQLSPEYKATRPRMPPALREQVAFVEAAAQAFGAAVTRVDGQEADDIIATLAVRHAADGVDVWSGDKDLLQLVGTDGVRVIADSTKAAQAAKVYASDDDVRAAFGVAAAQMGDYLALVGDASDNVPGVKGIGPKTAVKFLDAFGTLEDVLAKAPTSDVAGKAVRKKIADADHDAVRLSRRLVALDTAVALPDSLLKRRRGTSSDAGIAPGAASDEDSSAAPPEGVDFDWDRLLQLADDHGFEVFRRRVEAMRRQHSGPKHEEAALPF